MTAATATPGAPPTPTPTTPTTQPPSEPDGSAQPTLPASGRVIAPVLLPVNIDEATLVARANAAHHDTATKPDADDGGLACWSQENYQLTQKLAVTLGFPVAHLNAGTSRTVLIFGTSRWRDVSSGDGHVYRFGVSLRVLIELDTKDGTADLSLPVVAAKVELNQATASAQLIVRGYDSPDLGKLLPPWQSFNVDSYHEYMKAVSAIQTLITSNDDAVVPQLLATTVANPPQPPSPQKLGSVIGLRAIATGQTLADATDTVEPLDGDDGTAESVHTAIVNSYKKLGIADAAPPDNDTQKWARRLLDKIHPALHWWAR